MHDHILGLQICENVIYKDFQGTSNTMYMYWHFCTLSSFQSEEQTAKEFSKIVVDAESDYQVRITTVSCCSICLFLISELFVDVWESKS